MSVIDIRSLLEGNPRVINLYPNMQDFFKQYKTARDKVNVPFSEQEAFYAGYMLANPALREKLPKSKEAEFDARYN